MGNLQVNKTFTYSDLIKAAIQCSDDTFVVN